MKEAQGSLGLSVCPPPPGILPLTPREGKTGVLRTVFQKTAAAGDGSPVWNWSFLL